MAKVRQIGIRFNYVQETGKCGICNKENISVVEVGDIVKVSICDACAQQLVDVFVNMKLMRSGSY